MHRISPVNSFVFFSLSYLVKNVSTAYRISRVQTHIRTEFARVKSSIFKSTTGVHAVSLHTRDLAVTPYLMMGSCPRAALDIHFAGSAVWSRLAVDPDAGCRTGIPE